MRADNLIPLVATLVLIVFGLSIMLGRTHPFSPARASMRMRSVRGSNATLVVAVVSLAGLLFQTGAAVPARFTGPLVAAAVVAIVGLVLARPQTERLLAIVAAAAGIVRIGIEDGPGAMVATVFSLVLLLWLLGVVRGFSSWSR